MNLLTGAILSIAMSTITAQTQSDVAKAKPQVKLEIRIYRVLTNITGDGLTSQTLPGLPGSFQILHEKWDDVKVSMEKSELTWNGQPAPKHPRILNLGRPNLLVNEGQGARLEITDPVQYFRPEANGTYTLHHDGTPSLKISVLPKLTESNDQDRLDILITLKATYVTTRDPLPDVHLNVGKPNFETIRLEGNIGARNNQWTALRASIPSQGHIYLFIKPSTTNPNQSRN